ncbi:MAG TPA: GNAT family N-acyltransferase [Gallionella sp.]|nr:GNAT family N-acyltransferase [Gallionella sp.]
MLELDRTVQSAAQPRLIAGLARNSDEILEAQRLRYQIFRDEMGANLPHSQKGLDRDIYDKYCEHLLVRESGDNNVVGTCRLLAPDQAQKIGGYYAQTQFDLTRLLHLRGRMAEAGRTCIHRDYRDGATLNRLWDGIAQNLRQNRHEHLIGCVSIGIADGGHVAASLYRKLHRIYGAPIEYRVFPRNPLPLEALNPYLDAPIPLLLKRYLRLGAYICGEPAWDPAFNTADLLVLLPTSRLNSNANYLLK